MKLTEREKEIITTLRSMTKKRRELATDYACLNRVFLDIGDESAKEIAAVAKDLHPDALMIHPLYRSVFVVLPSTPETVGQLRAIMYHDPGWMGNKTTTKDNLPSFKEEIVIQGQRSGPDIYKNGEELLAERVWNANRPLNWDIMQLHHDVGDFVTKPTPANLRRLKRTFREIDRERKVVHARYAEVWSKEYKRLKKKIDGDKP